MHVDLAVVGLEKVLQADWGDSDYFDLELATRDELVCWIVA
jgi:hypothetical protein